MKIAKLATLILGLISGIFAVVKGASDFYALYEGANATFILTIDKDTAIAPVTMFNWAEHCVGVLDGPSYKNSIIDSKRPDTAKTLQAVRAAFKHQSDEASKGFESKYGQGGHYGSVTLTIQNKTSSNYDAPVLNISGLTSFDYWISSDDFLSIKQRDDFDRQVKETDLENGMLVIQLPKISNGGKFTLTIWGREAPFADADLKGVGKVKKSYVVKIADSTALAYARHPIIVWLLLVVTATLAFGLASRINHP